MDLRSRSKDTGLAGHHGLLHRHFQLSAVVIEDKEGWEIYPTMPVQQGAPPLLSEPATDRHKGLTIPTRTIKPSYIIRRSETGLLDARPLGVEPPFGR